ncbi:rot1 [Acrasis kona]|uniref:Rot1 n=1 Tax=Acrasis kona TaxID=1008807 RepID=A0AAW2ZBS6_9EUKA
MNKTFVSATIAVIITAVAVRAQVDPGLQGKWQSGGASASQYYDPSTGSYAPTSGTGFGYTFNNGRFTQYNLLQVTSYSCTTTLFLYQRGRVDKINDNTIRLSPIRGGIRKFQITCSRRDETVEYANYKIYQWSKEVDEYGTTNLYLNEVYRNGTLAPPLIYRADNTPATTLDFDVSGAMPNVVFNSASGTLSNTETGSGDNTYQPQQTPNSRSSSSSVTTSVGLIVVILAWCLTFM